MKLPIFSPTYPAVKHARFYNAGMPVVGIQQTSAAFYEKDGGRGLVHFTDGCDLVVVSSTPIDVITAVVNEDNHTAFNKAVDLVGAIHTFKYRHTDSDFYISIVSHVGKNNSHGMARVIGFFNRDIHTAAAGVRAIEELFGDSSNRSKETKPECGVLGYFNAAEFHSALDRGAGPELAFVAGLLHNFAVACEGKWSAALGVLICSSFRCGSFTAAAEAVEEVLPVFLNGLEQGSATKAFFEVLMIKVLSRAGLCDGDEDCAAGVSTRYWMIKDIFENPGKNKFLKLVK